MPYITAVKKYSCKDFQSKGGFKMGTSCSHRERHIDIFVPFTLSLPTSLRIIFFTFNIISSSFGKIIKCYNPVGYWLVQVLREQAEFESRLGQMSVYFGSEAGP